jgi:tryptophanyl-tRNA synthetase
MVGGILATQAKGCPGRPELREFYTEHGEGKKWYLQMKNYANELLHEELSSAQKRIVGTRTRFEWNNRFWESFVMPAGQPAGGEHLAE